MIPDLPVIVIDDNAVVRLSLRALLESTDLSVLDFASADEYLEKGAVGVCLIVDVNMPGMSGLELQDELARRNQQIPLIVMTGQADIALAVRAMKAGAQDFLEKPVDGKILLAGVMRAVADGRRSNIRIAEIGAALARLSLLTKREKDVLDRLTLGESNKAVAHHLRISPRTVAIHRARLQKKLYARSLSDLVRIMRAAGRLSCDDPVKQAC